MMYLLPRKWQIFIITYTTYAVVYITRKSFSVVKPLIQDDLNLTAYGLGSIDSAFLATYAIFQVFLPALSDTYGVRPVLLSALTSAAIFSLLFSIGTSGFALCCAWLMEGISHASLFAVLVKAVSLWFPAEERGTILGFWTSSQQVGAIVATSLTTFVSSRFGWRPAFFLAGCITFSTAVMVFFWLPEPPIIVFSQLPTQKSPTIRTLELSDFSTARRRMPGRASSEEPSMSDVSFKSQERNVFLKVGSDSVTIQDLEDGIRSEPPGQIVLALNDNDNNNVNNNIDKAGTTQLSSPLASINKVSPEGIESKAAASTSSETPGLGTATAATPMKFLEVLQIPGIIYCGAAYFCVKLVRYALLFWLPFYLVTEMNFSITLAGYSSMLFDLGGVAGAISSGPLVKKCFRGDKILAVAAMCIATSFALLLFSYTTIIHGDQAAAAITMSASSSFTGDAIGTKANDVARILSEGSENNVLSSSSLPASFVPMLILMAVTGFLIAGPDSILGAASAVDICERSGLPSAQLALSTATGIVNGVGSLGGVIQGFVTASVSDAFGWSPLFVIFAVVTVAGAGFLTPIITSLDAVGTSDSAKRSEE